MITLQQSVRGLEYSCLDEVARGEARQFVRHHSA
jgi:hypothetical protein